MCLTFPTLYFNTLFQDSQLFHCQDNDILYFWDTANNVYHYHSKLPVTEEEEQSSEGSEEEGELTDEPATSVN